MATQLRYNFETVRSDTCSCYFTSKNITITLTFLQDAYSKGVEFIKQIVGLADLSEWSLTGMNRRA